jgi:restriction system protein
MILNAALDAATVPDIALISARQMLKKGERAMAANGTGSDSLHQVVNQLKQQITALEKQHSRSVSQAIRPVQGEVERLKAELGRAQRKFNALEDEFKSFRAAERERRRQHEALTAGLLDARRATIAAEAEIAVIDTLLASAPPFRPPAFDELRDRGLVPDFDPGREAVAEPAPRWQDYDPGPPGLLSRATVAIGLTGGHERKAEDARKSYLADCEAHRDRELLRELRLAERREQYDRGVAEVRAAAAARNAEVERMRTAFEAGQAAAIAWFAREALERSEYPVWYPSPHRRYRIACHPDRAAMTVELELPSAADVPAVRRYEYDEQLAERREMPRSRAEISAQYAGLIGCVALRTASEALAATAERADAVRTVTVNGRATGPEAATGQHSRPHLISVSVTREARTGLFLTHVQPLSCLATLGARMSTDPLARAAVEPIDDFPESAEAQ